MPEHRKRADTGAILLLHPFIEDALHEIEIGPHPIPLCGRFRFG